MRYDVRTQLSIADFLNFIKSMYELLGFGLFIVIFLYSVILHEIAHGFVALHYGDDTAKISGRLSFNPLVHVDPVGSLLLPLLLYFSTGFAFGYAKPVPVNPYRLRGGSASYRMVSLAGIATNFAIALLAASVVKLTTQQLGFPLNNLGVQFFQLTMLLNIVLAVFNALPLPGFDGFNFLTTLPGVNDWLRRTPLGNPQLMGQYGIVISLLLLMLFWPFIHRIIAFFLNIFFGIFAL